MQFEELMTAVETYYSKSDKSVYAINTSFTGDLSLLFRLILGNNTFKFNSKVYKQIFGCVIRV